MFGIEIDEWPARISELALWVTDHQVNMEAGRRFGDSLIRLPLKASPTIRNDNALRISWNSVVPNEELFCIFGNPPFKGKQYRTPEQRQDMALTFQYAIDQDRAHGQALSRDGGTLDYVSCWYVIAAEYIRGTRIRVGFVSTNSITQGEQVGPLWSFMRDRGMIIHFAHRTFKWTNEVKNAAAVFCVIITFANFDTDRKFIAEYETPTSEPQIRYVPQINGYLINFPHMFLTRRTTPLCEVAAIAFGSMPNDDGALLLDEAERASLLSRYPRAAQFVRLCLGSKEYFSGRQRWCLWLVGVSPSTYRTIPEVMSRIRRVKQHRRESKRLQTQNLADTPHQFGEVRHTGEPYLLIPKVCSENRRYMPLSLMPGDVIVTDLCFEMPNATLWQFAILSSSMHMDWMRAVCGRLKGDYRYSAQFVYNNFPWPPRTSAALRRRVEQAATSLLAIRHRHQASGNTLADLYDPLAMPSDLTEAHHRLDRAVERCYLVAQRTGLGSESERVEHLFGLYLSLV
jgi:hypothetical protein